MTQTPHEAVNKIDQEQVMTSHSRSCTSWSQALVKSPVIVIKLAGRSPRLVRRWRELGLLPGFAMLTHQRSPQLASGQYTPDGLDAGSSQNRQLPELWANDLGFGSNSVYHAGIKTKHPDLGTESVIDGLPRQHSVQELIGSLLRARVSVIAIARALASSRPTLFDSRPRFDPTSLDWLRWEIFRSRWLTDQPATAMLNLPCPDSSECVGGAREPSFCPERQVDYAQSLMASYLIVDAIMQQAVRIAHRRQAGLIVSIDSLAANSEAGNLR